MKNSLAGAEKILYNTTIEHNALYTWRFPYCTGGKMSEKNDNEKQKSPIIYHNKDVISKIFGENLKEKSLDVYGINIPKIKAVLPTNLPVVEANEMRLDNIFQLEDDSVALIDYESKYEYADKIKYLNYVVRTLKRNELIGKLDKPIRMIVIYTGDVKKGSTDPKLDTGCLKFTVEEVFLSELDAVKIEEILKKKIENGGILTDKEQMQFVIHPLIYPGKEQKQEAIRKCFELAKKISSPEIQTFLLSGLLVFTDKVIAKQDSERIKRWINMTKVGQLFEEEKQEALRKLEEEQRKEIKRIKKAKKEAVKEAEKQSSRTIARRMLEKGMEPSEIWSFIPNLSYKDIEELKE